jgi:hypothetical protein
MKQANEYKPYESITAKVVLGPDGEVAARVWMHFGSTVTVTIQDYTNPAETNTQTGRAGGGGYDRATAAMTGMTIGPVTINDDCDRVIEGQHSEAEAAELAGLTLRQFKDAAYIANHRPDGRGDVYWRSGLDKLAAFGYRVIWAA